LPVPLPRGGSCIHLFHRSSGRLRFEADDLFVVEQWCKRLRPELSRRGRLFYKGRENFGAKTSIYNVKLGGGVLPGSGALVTKAAASRYNSKIKGLDSL
jgi:hypothetical protein